MNTPRGFSTLTVIAMTAGLLSLTACDTSQWDTEGAVNRAAEQIDGSIGAVESSSERVQQALGNAQVKTEKVMKDLSAEVEALPEHQQKIGAKLSELQESLGQAFSEGAKGFSDLLGQMNKSLKEMTDKQQAKTVQPAQ